MALVQPTFPSGTTAADLLFGALNDTFVADNVYFGAGVYTAAEVGTKFASKSAMATELSTNTSPLGELAEKPGKADSKCERLKTRNYQIPGKRTSTVELSITGLSSKQKDFLESSAFSGVALTLICTNREQDRYTIFNGMRWTVDWSGESDGLWTVVISSEYSGNTKDKLFLGKGLS